jgi:RimJ/RimL family protein N-acetyltransferase
MTDAANASDSGTAAKADAQFPLRPAILADIGVLHPRLMEAIQTSPHYSARFKAHETQRLTRGYLAALIAADPWHVAVMQIKDEPAGFMISGPELGTLWLYWSYVFPEKRKSAIALRAMRAFIEHWDNGRFHKIATYTKPGNDVAEAIMIRFGFQKTCTLEKHIFGEDYLLFEHSLTKTSEGYDEGVKLGRLASIKRWLKPPGLRASA